MTPLTHQSFLKILGSLTNVRPSRSLVTPVSRLHCWTTPSKWQGQDGEERQRCLPWQRGGKTVPLRTCVPSRCHFSSGQLQDRQISAAITSLSEKFAEAIELIGEARSSVGTVYFSEDMEDTQSHVQGTLDDYTTLLASLTPDQKKKVIQTVGLKMEELKAQMSLLEELAKE